MKWIDANVLTDMHPYYLKDWMLTLSNGFLLWNTPAFGRWIFLWRSSDYLTSSICCHAQEYLLFVNRKSSWNYFDNKVAVISFLTPVGIVCTNQRQVRVSRASQCIYDVSVNHPIHNISVKIHFFRKCNPHIGAAANKKIFISIIQIIVYKVRRTIQMARSKYPKWQSFII